MNRKIQIFLNSPWGVAGLVVCAAVVLYVNVIQPMLNESNSASVDADELGFDDFLAQKMEAGTEQKNVLLPEHKIDFGSLTWVNGNIRDPFMALSQPVSVAVSNKKRGVNTKPVLTAVIAGGDANLAVLDGKVVAEGNTIGRFTVASIKQASVSLKGPRGNVVININRRQR